MSDKQSVSVTINGHVYSSECEPRLTLADFIRHECGLTGTHLGCEHGVCGAVSVVPAR
jgi:aerobic-type carbon monoxide dehydrogenase small subunit (CoxS/CutS family)